MPDDRWRKVSEEMPEDGQRVLAYPVDSVGVVTFSVLFQPSWVDDYGTEFWPTHWRPLPAPPEED